MDLGLQLVNFAFGGEAAAALRSIGTRAERAGFSSLWVTDHLLQIPFVGPPEADTLEAFGLLSYLAGVTERVQLGVLVAGVTFRNPGVLVKSVTTLDHLSGGRAWLGLGAAWFEREHRALGIEFPPVKERMELLEETLQIAHQMWSGQVGPYRGKHYELAETLCRPLPLQRPHPPILVGGGGEQRTLALVARYARACNLMRYAGRKALARKLAVLDAHCQSLGRDPKSVEKTVTVSLKEAPRFSGEGAKSLSELLEDMHMLSEMGFDTLIYNCLYAHEPWALEVVAEHLAPAARRLPGFLDGKKAASSASNHSI
jgi:F420-dependent oxidoreductase-like protein